MNEPIFFPGGSRPHDLIGREIDLSKLREAIASPGRECRVVLIEGEGGVGKSRLATEMLQHLGVVVESNQDSQTLMLERWPEIVDKVIATGLIDLSETKLHTQAYLLSKLASPSTWTVPTSVKGLNRLFFTGYSTVGQEWQRLSDLGIAFTAVQAAAAQAEAAFWADYRLLTREKRAVITLDTAEQLMVSSQWLIDAGLLQQDDVLFHTQRWLLRHITQGQFTNTTLVIVSRSKKGKAFIQLLKETVSQTPNCEWISVPLEPFSLDEIRQYLQALAIDYQKINAPKSLLTYLQQVIGDEDRLKVLHLYTGGQPIRLALYVDVLLENATIPEPLQDTYGEAKTRTKWQEKMPETLELLEARKKIEAEFSRSLFNRSEDEQLTSQILQLLARCPQGLTAQQIDFVLHSNQSAVSVADWRPDPNLLQHVNTALAKLGRLIIVKTRDNGKITYLQDEMYRIYDQSMGNNEANRKAEERARTWLYNKLRAWAEFQRQALQEQRTIQVKEALGEIRMERPSRISSIRLPTRTAVEEEKLTQLESQLLDAELEYLHYELLLDPQDNLNDTYYDLINRRETAYREDQINVLQAETDRLIRNKDLMHLRPLKSRPAVEERQETPYAVILRVLKTDEAIKWLVRFFLRKEYKRAIQLAGALEDYISNVSDLTEQKAWQHTLNRTERACYYHFTRIYDGQDAVQSIEALKALVGKDAPLIKLSEMTEDEILPETGERGFIGHPAHTRLLFVAAISWNVIGYGYTTLGQYREAVNAYTTSLLYTRQVKPSLMVARQATTTNNLARVLSEIGRWHGVRLCRDALERRIGLGDWLPIAYSYNTMALIYNDFKEPQAALESSAIALAIARFMQDDRAVGLAMLQVGEALRNLVTQGTFPLEDPAEEIYREATNILIQTHEIFQNFEEPLRLAETLLELGSLYRDRTEYAIKTGEKEWQRWADNATHFLREAAKMAERHGWAHLSLDAWVSMGTIYYFNSQPISEILLQIEKLVPENSPARLRPEKEPPLPQQQPSYIFKQLNKLHDLLGRLAFDKFTEKMLILRQIEPDRKKRQEKFQTDNALQGLLKQATEQYVLAVNYGQLYAPGSATLTNTYDWLYSYLRKLNYQELSKFYQYKTEIEALYQIDRIQFEQPGNIDDFLWSSFGGYSGLEEEASNQRISWSEK